MAAKKSSNVPAQIACSPGPDQFTQADGRQLAVDLFRELHDAWLNADDVADDDDTCNGFLGEDPEVLRRYLSVVAQKASPELERGFLAVLTDFITGSLDGAMPDVVFYEERPEPRTSRLAPGK